MTDLASINGQWLIVAEASRCIPLPWLCLFAEADLRPCKFAYNRPEIVDGEQRKLLSKFSILNPSTSVSAAKNNLARARHIFEALAGDAETGTRHWQAALAALDALPLGYLTIDPTEVLLLGDLKTGAMELASAISSGDASLAAKRRLAGLAATTDEEKPCNGLDGGFMPATGFQKHERSVETAEKYRKILAKLDTCNMAETEDSYNILPLDLSTLNPPDGFWNNPELLAIGARQITVGHGNFTIKDGKRHYATSLTNASDKRIRVVLFGGFAKVQGSYALANDTKAWFTARNFIDWYSAPESGWILPGTTVTDRDNWGGDDEAFWAYWCENEDGERFMALAQNPSASTITSARHSLPPPWEAISESDRAGIDKNITVYRSLARDMANIAARQDTASELATAATEFDLNGIRWLDDLLEYLHTLPRSKEKLVPVFGAYLGECLIRTIGGEWAIYDGSICVRYDDGNAVFPLNKVRKHLENGKEGGDSVLGLYQTEIALRPKPLTDWQRRLLSLYEHRSDCEFFVSGSIDSTQEWARVKKIQGLWVTVETTLTAGLQTEPQVSYRLDGLSGFYAADASGALIDAEGFTGASDVFVPIENIDSQDQFRQTPSQPADAAMAQAMARLRNAFSGSQKQFNARALDSVRAPCPLWMNPSEPLYQIIDQQSLLLAKGTIVWAALIQANKLLFTPGADDCPAQLVYSRDPYFDPRPQELRAIGHRLFELKNTAPANQAEKAAADRITDEMDRSMGWRLPDALTFKAVYATTFMVFRQHIPNGVLSAGCFPILTHPSTPAVMIVPYAFWPIELITLWREKKL